MPFNKLHLPNSITSEQARAISEALHGSLVETCGVNSDDNFNLITRYSPDDMLFHPTFLGERDPGATVVIEIVLLSGRSDEQKESLYKDFRGRLQRIGFDPKNSIMFLVENNSVDWSFSDAGSVKTVLGL